jgi:hypothetical protein
MGIPNKVVLAAVHEWCSSIWEQDFKGSVFGPSGILTDSTVEALASVGPILSLIHLEKVVGESCPWFAKYGDSLLSKLISLSIPPMQPKLRQTRADKRVLEDGDHGLGGKRARRAPGVNIPTQTLSPLYPNSAALRSVHQMVPPATPLW